jgi:methionyl-tRNA synthetase
MKDRLPMSVRSLDPQTFFHAYNVDLQLLYPWDGVVEPPFGAAWAVLKPGESTKPHAHQECETFFIAGGRGELAVGDERVPVEVGSVSFHRPFHNHILTNTSDSEDLLFLTVWWEDKGQWGSQEPALAATEEAPERLLVTAAPPTPNGDLHLGHLAGPYLAADFFTRAQRLQGVDAYFACGSDDNAVYVKTMGEALGLGPQEAADRFADGITATLAAAGIDLAVFPRPNASAHHHTLVQSFFQRLYDQGALVERDTPLPYCEPCQRHLFEPYVRGRCPHCGSGVVGNTCEDCGRINGCLDLQGATCTTCGTAAVTRPLKRLFFPLEDHRATLIEHYRRVHLSSHVRALVEKVLAGPLPEVPVTCPTDWGIPVPVPGYDDQRIYVWLEMAPRYFVYIAHLNDKLGAAGGYERYFKSRQARVVQFFGYDNSFYYSMLLPALWTAFDPEIQLPYALVTNEFYRLDGLKFSTSRNHRILGCDFLREVPREAARFFLAWSAPEREQTNFTREDFREVVERELLMGWEPWLVELLHRLSTDFAGQVPSTGDWTREHRAFYQRLEELLREVQQAYGAETFSPQRVTRLLSELVREARRFGAGERHWDGVATRTEERRTGIALEALAAKLLALLAAPITPQAAARIYRALGYGADPGDGSWAGALDWLPGGQPVAALSDALFPGLAAAVGRGVAA